MSTEPRSSDEAGGRPAARVGEPDVVLTPRQIFGGFVLLAALVALLLRRRRRS